MASDKSKCCGCSPKFWSILAIVFFTGFLIVGFVVPGVVEDALWDGIKEASVITSEKHKSYDGFVDNAAKKSSPPLWKKYYMFNVTNPAEVERDGAKPMLQEVGPYTYRSHRLKLNVTFNRYPTDKSDAASIEYTDYTYQIYHPEQSCKDCDPYADEFTIPSLSFWTLYSAVKHDPVYTGILGELIKNFPGHKAFVTNTVDKLLWGFDDPLLVFLGDALKDLNITIPSRLSLQTNHTSPEHAAEDTCRDAIDNGHADPARLHMYDEWHCKTQVVGIWATPEPIYGTDAQQTKWDMDCSCKSRMPPWQRLANETHPISDVWGPYPEAQLSKSQWPCKGPVVPLWVDTIERTLPFQCFSDSQKIHGIKLLKYQGALSLMQNATLNPMTANYHQYGLGGFFNMSQAGPKAPLYLSKPHFLDADPLAITMVDGVTPAEPKKHDIWVLIEPYTGLTMQAFKRLQPNMLMEPNMILPKIPRSYTPMAWIEESSQITSKLANDFKDSVYLAITIRDVARYGGFSVAAAVCLLTAVVWYVRRKRRSSENQADMDFYEYTTLYDGVYDDSINH